MGKRYHARCILDQEKIMATSHIGAQCNFGADAGRITRCYQNGGARDGSHDLSIAHVDYGTATQPYEMSFTQIAKQTVKLNPAYFLAAW